MTGRLIGVAGFALMWCAGQTSAEEKRSVLRGQVVDGVSGRPMAGVALGLEDSDWKMAASTIAADAEGRFSFQGLRAGEYILSATRADFGKVYYDELPEPGYVQVIRIKPEDEEKVVVFRVMPRSVVTGTVRDETGEVVEHAIVTARRAAWTDGHITWQTVQQATTDDRGRYRIGNLPPGGYVVCAGVMEGRNIAPTAGPVDFAARGEPRFYGTACYPEMDGRAITPFHLAPGRQTAIDLSLRSAPAATVRGRLLNQPPQMGLGIQLVPAEGGLDSSVTLSGSSALDGTFAIAGVAPGRYRLEASANWQTESGESKTATTRFPLTVGSGSVDGLEVPLEPTAVIDVVLHGPGADKAVAEEVGIGLRSTVDASSGTAWSQALEPGRLHFGELAPGSYWVLTKSTRDVCIASIKMGEQEVLRRTLTVAPGMTAKLDATLTKDCGEVQARVVTGGKPVPDAKVLLLISGSANAPGDLVTDYADEQGELKFAGLAPGTYRLWAWKMDESGAFSGPGAVAGAEGQAVTVVREKRDAAKVDVPLLREERERR
jgi:protocatechuate 3,4-dioxygenase beta subunit